MEAWTEKKRRQWGTWLRRHCPALRYLVIARFWGSFYFNKILFGDLSWRAINKKFVDLNCYPAFVPEDFWPFQENKKKMYYFVHEVDDTSGHGIRDQFLVLDVKSEMKEWFQHLNSPQLWHNSTRSEAIKPPIYTPPLAQPDNFCHGNVSSCDLPECFKQETTKTQAGRI